jgi:hypothetical protein
VIAALLNLLRGLAWPFPFFPDDSDLETFE